MLNKAILVGRLTADPELRQTPNGISVISFSIACDRDFKQKDKEKHLKMLEYIFRPIMSVSDAPCNFGIAEFLKFLKQMAMNSMESECFEQIVEMITMFSMPKAKIVQKTQ